MAITCQNNGSFVVVAIFK